jgi:hypothetical protein
MKAEGLVKKYRDVVGLDTLLETAVKYILDKTGGGGSDAPAPSSSTTLLNSSSSSAASAATQVGGLQLARRDNGRASRLTAVR